MIANNQKLQKEILTGLKKSIWTLNKVINMVENDIYCVDIASQINASIGLLKSANSKMLENHIRCCGPKFLAAKDENTVNEFVKELMQTWSVTNR